MPKKTLLFASIFFFLVFCIFTYLVHLGVFVKLDFDMTVKLQDKIPAILTLPFSALSLLGSFEIATLLLLIFIFILKRLNKFFVLLTYSLVLIIELLAKYFVDHKGPPFMFFRYDIPFYFPTSHVQPGFSYPSGHMARTAFISAIIFIYIFNKKDLSSTQKYILILLLLAFNLLMIVSRVYLGEHWTTDVVGGVLLGVSFGFASTFSLKMIKQKLFNLKY